MKAEDVQSDQSPIAAPRIEVAKRPDKRRRALVGVASVISVVAGFFSKPARSAAASQPAVSAASPGQAKPANESESSLSRTPVPAGVPPTFRQPAIGAIPRSVQQELEQWVSVKDFGAVGDGITDDTTAFRAAWNFCMNSISHTVIKCDGSFIFNPTSLDLRSATKKVTLLVNGQLKPTSTISIDAHLAIVGVGGAQPGLVQFTLGECCEILAPEGNIPVLQFAGSADHTLRNVVISHCFQGLMFDGASALGALARLENVNVLCDKSGGNAIVIDAFFWIWFKNCKFLTTVAGAKSVLITNSSTTYSQAGLIFFEDCITASRGISVNPSIGNCGNIYFKNHHHESLSPSEDFFFAKRGSYNISFSGLAISDSLPGAGYTFDLLGVTGFRLDNSYPATFRNPPMSGSVDVDQFFYYANTTIDILSDRDQVHTMTRGAISGRLLSRGYSQAATLCVGVPIQVKMPTGSVGGSTGLRISENQPALDGTNTAFLVEPSAGAIGSNEYACNVYDQGENFESDEWYVFFSMIKAASGSAIGASGHRLGALALGVSQAANTQIEIPYGIGFSRAIAGTVGPDTQLKDDGWIPAAAYFKVVSASTSRNKLVATLHCLGGSSYYIWRPAIRRIPKTFKFTASDVVKLVQSMAAPPDAPSGVVAIQAHQTFLTGKGITADRPVASAVGQGAQFFDTSLGVPIWSDGTHWRTAAGEVV
jgi:hypothetical protein